MKKRILILSSLCTIIAFVGCGGKEQTQEQIQENMQEISQSLSSTLDFNIDINNIAKEETNILDEVIYEKFEIEEYVEQKEELSKTESVFGQGSNISKYKNYVGNKNIGSFGTNYNVEEVYSFPIILNPEDDYNSSYYIVKDDCNFCYVRVSLVEEIQDYNVVKSNFSEVTSKLNYDSILEDKSFVLNTVISKPLNGLYQKFFYEIEKEGRFLINIIVENKNTMSYISFFGDNIDFIVSLVNDFSNSFEYFYDNKENRNVFKLFFDELNFNDKYFIIENNIVVDLEKYKRDFDKFENEFIEIEYTIDEELIEIDGKQFYNANIFNMYIPEDINFDGASIF